MTTAGDTFRRHHQHLRTQFAEYARVLEEDGDADPEPLVAFLKTELLPHASGEEAHLYPAVEPVLEAHGMATATMRVDHRFIEEYVRRIDAAVASMRAAPPGARARVRAQVARMAAQLQAVFEVHLAKEEQVYLPLFEQYVPAGEQEQVIARLHGAPSGPDASPGEAALDVRTVPPPLRHPLILQTFESLAPGQGFTLVNDHDPKPLYYQFQAERPGEFTWEYLEQGPEVWRVRIGRVA